LRKCGDSVTATRLTGATLGHLQIESDLTAPQQPSQSWIYSNDHTMYELCLRMSFPVGRPQRCSMPEGRLIGVAARSKYDRLIHGFLLLGYSLNPARLAIELRCKPLCCSRITIKAGSGSCIRQYQQATSRAIPLSPTIAFLSCWLVPLLSALNA